MPAVEVFFVKQQIQRTGR